MLRRMLIILATVLAFQTPIAFAQTKPIRDVLGAEVYVAPEDMARRVYNDTGGTLAEGTLVYISSWSETDGAWKVAKADADDPTKVAQYVVRIGTIANTAYGSVSKGYRSTATMNTGGATVGDFVYLSATAGEWTLTAPSGADQDQQIVGSVAVVSATVGVINFWFEDVPQQRGTSSLQDSAVTSGKIAADTIAAGDIAAGAVGTSEILDATIAAADIAADTITWAEIADSGAIDADAAYTAADGIQLKLSPTHTSGDNDFLFIDANQTDDAAATDDFIGFRLDITSESGDAGDTIRGIKLNVKEGTANTIIDAGILIDNAETTASTLTDAIIITSSGVDGGVVDAIDVSASNITNSVNVGANPIVTGNVAGTIGDATTDAWTITTDGTGDAEVVLPAGAVSGTEILDATVASADLDVATVQYAEVSLTNAQVLALRATPITLVAAPAAGKVHEFISVMLFFDYTGAYTETADNLVVRYTNTTGIIVSGTIEMTGFIDATADTAVRGIAITDAIVAKTGCDAQALVLHNSGDGEFGAGNAANTIRVKVAYRTHAAGW